MKNCENIEYISWQFLAYLFFGLVLNSKETEYVAEDIIATDMLKDWKAIWNSIFYLQFQTLKIILSFQQLTIIKSYGENWLISVSVWLGLFNGISTTDGLFNVKIWLLVYKSLIIIIAIFSISFLSFLFNHTFLLVNNNYHLFAHSYMISSILI